MELGLTGLLGQAQLGVPGALQGLLGLTKCPHGTLEIMTLHCVGAHSAVRVTASGLVSSKGPPI